MFRKALCLVLVIIFLLSCAVFLSACGEEMHKYTVSSFDHFDTVTTVIGYEKSRADFDRTSAEILNELGRYHRLFDIYNTYEGVSNLCTVNGVSAGGQIKVQVDAEIIYLLLYSKEAFELSEGTVNIGLGGLLSIWHEYRGNGADDPTAAKIPPYEMLADAAEHCDINDIVIDKEEGTVLLADDKMKIDVGAIAKGYAVEAVARSFEEKGLTGYVINAGGNIRTLGNKPDFSAWTVGIESPLSEDEFVAEVRIDGYALATSGSYRRYYEVDGKRYNHVIDPKTLMPSDRFASVSVICPSAADADVLSTALFCMDYEEGLRLISKIPDAEALWVFNSGETKESNGFSKYSK
jgi:thiamine biosynthesis lipoprotein